LPVTVNSTFPVGSAMVCPGVREATWTTRAAVVAAGFAATSAAGVRVGPLSQAASASTAAIAPVRHRLDRIVLSPLPASPAPWHSDQAFVRHRISTPERSAAAAPRPSMTARPQDGSMAMTACGSGPQDQ
jgi:hypothetical protein